MKTKFLTIIILFIIPTLRAQITFEKKYLVFATNLGTSVYQTYDDGYILTGYSPSDGDSVFLIKTDPSGNMVWSKNLGKGEGNSVLQAKDSGFVVAGRTSINGIYDFLVIKTDIDGNIAWKKTYGGTETEDAYSIYQTIDNGFIVGGRTGSTGDFKMFILKLDSDGNEVWSKSFGGGLSDMANKVQQTNDGGYILAGISTFNSNQYNLVKTDNLGNILWYNTQGGGYGASSGIQLVDGGYALTINHESGANLIRTDELGNIIWNKFYSCGGYCSLSSVQQTPDNGLIALGSSAPDFSSPQDLLLMKTNINGDSLWLQKFGGNSQDQGREVKLTSDGGYVLVGRSDEEGYLVKTNGNGEVLTNMKEIGIKSKNSFYPNPSKSGIFNLKDGNGLITVYNILGKVVYKEVVTGKDHLIDLSLQSAGTYFVKIERDYEVITGKVFISK